MFFYNQMNTYGIFGAVRQQIANIKPCFTRMVFILPLCWRRLKVFPFNCWKNFYICWCSFVVVVNILSYFLIKSILNKSRSIISVCGISPDRISLNSEIKLTFQMLCFYDRLFHTCFETKILSVWQPSTTWTFKLGVMSGLVWELWHLLCIKRRWELAATYIKRLPPPYWQSTDSKVAIWNLGPQTTRQRFLF